MKRYMHISMWATTEVGPELSSIPEEVYQKIASFFTGDMSAGLWLRNRGIKGFENIKVRVHLTDDPKRTVKKVKKTKKKKSC